MANGAKILITGATGKVGGALLDNLGNADVDLRALAHHDESEAHALGERGVDAVPGDFLEPDSGARKYRSTCGRLSS
jgi:NAD(P)H dehydrogenase (quinone)